MKHAGVIMATDLKETYKKYPFLIKGVKENENGDIQELLTLGEEDQVYDLSWNPGGGCISDVIEFSFTQG